ncbi:penicillin acylase family protein, partial [Candidatus Aminicenantes bacterium AC-708-I09]|nr:penicillin acylase family protein [Candidatus Aminicenantes bacterium AC-708-I09]
GLKVAAKKDLEKLSPHLKEIFSYYCKGVNAYLKKKKILPPEFIILRFKPEKWTILDSLVIKQIMDLTLSNNMDSEFLRMKLMEKFNIEEINEIMPSVPEAKFNFSFKFKIEPPSHKLEFAGSNNWVVSGELTKTGKPLLANDPHLAITIPSIWYQIHLNSPEMNVIGVSIPGTPMVVIGHNENIAWGVTYSYVDVQDLYLEKLDKKQRKYFFNGKWRNLEIHREEIKIKGEKKPKIIEVKWTHRGPIISPWILKSDKPVSLRWTIYDGGRTPRAIYLINKARNWKEFLKAVSLFDSPSLNFVYADRDGNIGYYLSGKIPIRRNHRGLFPVTGDTDKFEWIGYIEKDEKRIILNPPENFIVTANNKIIENSYPFFLGVDYLAPFRAKRIKELILTRKKHDLNSFKKIQLDLVLTRSRLFIPIIKNLKNLKGKAREAQKILENWDGSMEKGKEAALFQYFLRFLNENTFKDELKSLFSTFAKKTALRWAGILKIINKPNSKWFDDINTEEIEDRNKIIEKSLQQAYEYLENKFGQPENWDWAKIHKLQMEHALGAIPIFKFLNRGPYPMKNDSETVNATYVSYRQIIDLSNFDNSLWVNTSGESGHFLSKHYDDQIKLWLTGGYYRMLFTKKEIEKKAKAKLILKPAI